jgi:putative FmdB family regulatory protein
MPIYEYYCSRCKKEFELIRPMPRMEDPAACPSCGVEGKRLVSAAASKVGFYVRPPTKPPFRQHGQLQGRSGTNGAVL